MAYWTARLDGGAPLQNVALGLSASREYYNDVVNSLYVTYLGRQSDTPGLNSWVDKVVAGTGIESIRVDIVSSQEYYNDGGATPVGYIAQLYQAFLQRAPDAGGLANWQQTLAGPGGTAAVAGGFVYAAENYNDVIKGYYQTYLQRVADDGGVTIWVNSLESGTAESQIIADFVSSAEYLVHHGVA